MPPGTPRPDGVRKRTQTRFIINLLLGTLATMWLIGEVWLRAFQRDPVVIGGLTGGAVLALLGGSRVLYLREQARRRRWDIAETDQTGGVAVPKSPWMCPECGNRTTRSGLCPECGAADLLDLRDSEAYGELRERVDQSDEKQRVALAIAGAAVLAVALAAGAAQLSEQRDAICPEGSELVELDHFGGKGLAERWCQDASGTRQGPYSRWHSSGVLAEETGHLDGDKHGPHRLWDENGRQLVDAHFELGRRQGPWKQWTPAGQLIKEAVFKDGLPEDGVVKEWHANGILGKEATYLEGQTHGPVRSWYSSGQLREEGHFIAGARQGLHTSWTDSGEVSSKAHYEAGQRVGVSSSWWSDGTPKTEQGWKDGREQGLHRSWHASGGPEEESTYNDGHLDGPHRSWSAQGVLLVEGHYVAGEYDGTWTWYYASGPPKARIDYTASKRTGQRVSWHENGQKSGEQERYVDDKEEGVWTAWDEQGRVEESGPYEAGQAHGTWRYYEEGELVTERDWERGDLIATRHL